MFNSQHTSLRLRCRGGRRVYNCGSALRFVVSVVFFRSKIVDPAAGQKKCIKELIMLFSDHLQQPKEFKKLENGTLPFFYTPHQTKIGDSPGKGVGNSIQIHLPSSRWYGRHQAADQASKMMSAPTLASTYYKGCLGTLARWSPFLGGKKGVLSW